MVLSKGRFATVVEPGHPLDIPWALMGIGRNRTPAIRQAQELLLVLLVTEYHKPAELPG